MRLLAMTTINATGLVSARATLVNIGIALVTTCAAVGAANAADPVGDARQLSAGRSLALNVCSTCHGVDGSAAGTQFPKLAGQVSGFTALQLRNYRSGERPNPIMAAVAKPLDDAQIDAVAAYYASLAPMRPDTPSDPARALAGEQIYQMGKPGAPACRYCHGVDGAGLAPVFPRLAGQHAGFVYAALQPYQHVADFKNPYAFVMKAVVQNLSDDDLKAVAAYVSGMSSRP